jgi:CobQ-like glutamine amidotransferase family enzyme
VTLLNMVTDRPQPLHMKRYRGPAVTKTVQIQAQLSERLTGFVNNTGYTVKDVVNKAVEEFLERYGR